MDSSIDIAGILQRLPHRYPFLLVDRITHCEPGSHITGLKNVTMNEPFFQGHFPDYPVMPGVLILEALAQLAGLLAMRTEDADSLEKDKRLYFAGIDDARFKRPVLPGDQLILAADLIKHRRDIWRFGARATVDGALAAEGTLTCAIKAV